MDLPGEIIFIITSFCAPIDYYNLCIASRQVAEIAMYKNRYRKLHIVKKYDIDKVYETLIDGTLHGEYTVYDGFDICEVASYRKGKKHGQYRLYTNGILIYECHYVNGLRQKIAYNYYKSGVEKSRYNYVNDVLSGPYKRFYANGNIMSEGHYENGNDKPLIYYHHKGGKSTEYNYNAYGMRTVNFFDKNGNNIHPD